MRTLVMGVVNVTPDSFFDGGRYFDPEVAIAHGLDLIDAGADLVDVGGESSRPGAEPVEEAEELRRILPVIDALAGRCRVSVDTAKANVAVEAIEAGASLVNDISAGLARVAASKGAGLCVMHMHGTPRTMQVHPSYEDVVAEVRAFLLERARHARDLGVEEIYIDPGIGFGKTVEHNLALLGALPDLVETGEAVLVGVSRKQFLGRVAAKDDEGPLGPEDRFEASLAAAVHAMVCGAAIVRVHDVAPTVDASRLVEASLDAAGSTGVASTGVVGTEAR